MRQLIQLTLVLGLLVTGLPAQTVPQTPAKMQVVIDGLTWPEIKDPQVLIDLAKTAIAEAKARPKGAKETDHSKNQEIAYLHPSLVLVFPETDHLLIALDTHPYTGQGLVILPDPARFPSARFWVDTKTPEIKRTLLPLNDFSGLQSSLGDIAYSVAFKKIQNLDREKATSPKPLDMSLPAYPNGLMMAGLIGEAKVEFTVSEQGRIAVSRMDATFPEFEATVREAMSKWSFEPAVSRETRQPVPARITLSIIFDFKE